MLGIGKKKATQDQFEAELEELLKVYQQWDGGATPYAAPTLLSQLNRFRCIRPERKDSERLSKALCDTVENQVKAMSQLAISGAKDSFPQATKELRIGQAYLDRMNRAAVNLVSHIEALEESNSVRKLLIEYGVYDPTATE